MPQDEIAEVFRSEAARAVAALARNLGDLDLAEEAVQEALAVALERWPRDGVPAKPGAWITTVARNRAVDHLRRERSLAARREASLRLAALDDTAGPTADHSFPDDRLALLFTCCHPALSMEASVALTLRMLGGLTTGEIARAFLVPETTMAARITRAKKKIRVAGIAFRVPDDDELPERVAAVLAVLYLVFNEGYRASAGPDLVRVALCEEAIRLARVTVELMPDEPEAIGLLALMLLQHSRRAARVDRAGKLVRLPDQDRSLWDRDAIAEGARLVEDGLRRGRPGPYRLQAAIASVHAADGPTDWAEIKALYGVLQQMDPSPLVALNAAVAVAEVDGAGAALALVEPLGDRLVGYQPFHVVRAELLLRLGRESEAAAAFERAIALAGTEPERQQLRERLALVAPPPARRPERTAP